MLIVITIHMLSQREEVIYYAAVMYRKLVCWMSTGIVRISQISTIVL